MNSNELFVRSEKVSPGGVHSPVRAFQSVGGQPMFFDQAEGAYLSSVEGKSYIDFCQSFGPNLLGHRDPEVTEEVHKAVDTAWTFGACEPYSLELNEWMCQRLPWIEKLRFVNSGTEAVMSALRLVRAATGREKILKFEGCYHGHVDSMLVQAGSGLAGESASSSAGVSGVQASQTLVTKLNDEAAVEEIFSQHGADIAAIIVEPLPANYGLLKQRPEFLHFLRSISEKHGALLIFDEVISGFRVALGGMAELSDIRPDLVTYGKIIGGGFPVGCYGGRKDLMDQLAPNGPVYQAGTLSANPIGMRAGLATLKKVEREKVYEVLEKRSESFVSSVNEILSAKDMQMIRQGSLFWITAKVDTDIRDLEAIPKGQSESFAPLFHALIKNGVYIAPSGFEVGFVSYAHDDKVLSTALEGFQKAVNEL